jgi:hypothetical protein
MRAPARNANTNRRRGPRLIVASINDSERARVQLATHQVQGNGAGSMRTPTR